MLCCVGSLRVATERELRWPPTYFTNLAKFLIQFSFLLQTDKQSTTDGMVDTMFTAVFDESESNERKVQVKTQCIESFKSFAIHATYTVFTFFSNSKGPKQKRN